MRKEGDDRNEEKDGKIRRMGNEEEKDCRIRRRIEDEEGNNGGWGRGLS